MSAGVRVEAEVPAALPGASIWIAPAVAASVFFVFVDAGCSSSGSSPSSGGSGGNEGVPN
jgi:hypothetical protein